MGVGRNGRKPTSHLFTPHKIFTPFNVTMQVCMVVLVISFAQLSYSGRPNVFPVLSQLYPSWTNSLHASEEDGLWHFPIACQKSRRY